MKNKKKFVIVIPARYQSSRFPGKPLVNINGKVLLQHVYDKCVSAVNKKLIYVATDDKRILKNCFLNNIQCLMTSKKCKTGTDRIFEVSKKIKAFNYINIQGDEPLIEKSNIKKFLKKINVVNLKSNNHPVDVPNDVKIIKKLLKKKSIN